MGSTNLTTRGSLDILAVCVRAISRKNLISSRESSESVPRGRSSSVVLGSGSPEGPNRAAFQAARPVTEAYLTAAEAAETVWESVTLMGSHRTSIPTRMDRSPRDSPVAGSASKRCELVPYPRPEPDYLTGILYTSNRGSTTGRGRLLRDRLLRQPEQRCVEAGAHGIVVAVVDRLPFLCTPPGDHVDRSGLYLR